MPIPGPAPTNPVPPGPNTVGQVITNALYWLNVVAPGEVPDALEMATGLAWYCQLADSWNTQQYYIFASDLLSASPINPFAPFQLVPGLVAHTIGPAAVGAAPAPNFLVNNERPVRIRNANIIQNNVFPVVRFPLYMRDKDWWAKNRIQTIQTSLPTDLYYRPDWPLGTLFFWPVPNFAYLCEFEIETILQGAAQLAQAFAAPPGYELALTMTLAELLSVPFEKPLNPALAAMAAKARLAVQGLNSAAPRISLDDFGRPSTERPRASWNYYTGLSR